MDARMRFEIDGMSCGHCVAAVRRALEQLPGVTVEHVEIGSATVSLDPARATPDAVVDAVADEGYAASLAAA
jgi:copper chaperone CopZ